MNKLDMIKKICEDTPSAQAFYLLAEAYTEEGHLQEAHHTLSQAIPLADSELLPKLMELISKIALPEPKPEPSLEPEHTPDTETNISTEEIVDEDRPSISIVTNGETKQVLTVLPGGKAEKKTDTLETHNRQKKITFADVGGLDDVKALINMRIIQPFLRPDLFEKFGKKSGGGVLLFGPPGCGKTYIAKATAGECRSQFISVSITDVLDKWLGESERKMENILQFGR